MHLNLSSPCLISPHYISSKNSLRKLTFQGIETIRKHKLTSIDDERGMLEYELQRMHREAKKNALLAEAEGRIQARADKNTQAYSGIKSTF